MHISSFSAIHALLISAVCMRKCKTYLNSPALSPAYFPLKTRLFLFFYSFFHLFTFSKKKKKSKIWQHSIFAIFTTGLRLYNRISRNLFRITNLQVQSTLSISFCFPYTKCGSKPAEHHNKYAHKKPH